MTRLKKDKKIVDGGLTAQIAPPPPPGKIPANATDCNTVLRFNYLSNDSAIFTFSARSLGGVSAR